MRKPSTTPRPGKRFANGSWTIFWRFRPASGDYRQYTVATGLAPENDTKNAAEIILRQFSAALAMDNPIFPSGYENAPAVVRYLIDRYGKKQNVAHGSSETWIDDYAIEIAAECKKKWSQVSVFFIRQLQKKEGPLEKLTPESAFRYLAAIAKNNSPATRNRALAAFNRFFKWAISTKRTTKNPFEECKILKEERRSEIVYCTHGEITEIIEMARDTGWEQWIAVPIAFYTGLRREEISLLRWKNIKFNGGRIVVIKSKNGKGRTLPLSRKLAEILQTVPEESRTGFVVPCPPDIKRIWRMDNLVQKIQKTKRDKILLEWNISRPPPSRAADYREKKAAFEAAKEAKKTALKEILERIGWNAWRHTFGSLHAQAGVSLDKICAWMGNTPEVCRRHYAQFVPRNRHDEDIDKI